MIKEIEISRISTKYESCRLKDKFRQQYLLDSILKNGVREPLQCVGQSGRYILLDGFKRLRCCIKLKISCVPITIVSTDEAESILHVVRLSNEKSLNILEQARFVDELRKNFNLKVSEIAGRLDVSNAWVSVRLGILSEMSDLISKEVFSGRFPLRSYMYTLRQFTRVNKIPAETVDRFVKAVSGKSLSQRKIEKLAYGYFRGSDELRKQIEEGRLQWTLRQLDETHAGSHTQQPELEKDERDFIRDLELLQKYIGKVNRDLRIKQTGTSVFIKTVRLLLAGIINSLAILKKGVTEYDCREHT
jgi:ParB/RepB/Spo0J family partition protein